MRNRAPFVVGVDMKLCVVKRVILPVLCLFCLRIGQEDKKYFSLVLLTLLHFVPKSVRKPS